MQQIGKFTEYPKTKSLVAVTHEGNIGGAVVYFANMAFYILGGVATKETNASENRLLEVAPSMRGLGFGKRLTETRIRLAITEKQHQLINYSTKAMQTA